MEISNLKLIVGLGNPGIEYRFTRHNIGFMVLEALASNMDIQLKRVKFKAQIGSGKINDVPVILSKPLTFMNLSGNAVGSLAKYFNVELANIFVIHDDLDLPLGKLRLRPMGGSAGHNGIQSIIEKLNSSDFPRMRVGIGRPPGRMDPNDFVLKDFLPSEKELKKLVIEQAVNAALTYIQDGLEKAMNIYNGEVG